METPGDTSVDKAKGHGRQASSGRRQDRQRSSTIGPLDTVDPLSEPSTPSKSTAEDGDDSLNAANASQSPPPPITAVERPQKDFGYLLKSNIFHSLSQHDVPASFRETPSIELEGRPLAELLSSGYFRAAATTAAAQLASSTEKKDYQRIFSLYYIRLACLQLLGHHVFAAQEIKAFQDMNASFYRDPLTNQHLIPWELRVIAVRLQAIAFGDWRRGVMSYYELAQDARDEVRSHDGRAKRLWKDRLRDLGVQVCNALIEMGDLDGAIRHLKTLPVDGKNESNRMRLALLNLRVGDIAGARNCFRDTNGRGSSYVQQVLDALCKMAEGDYNGALDAWTDLKTAYPSNSMAASNLAVCMIYAERIIEARSLLQELADQGRLDRAITFNLSTMYELCSEKSRALKQDLATKAAEQEPTSVGWERVNADFKL